MCRVLAFCAAFVSDHTKPPLKCVLPLASAFTGGQTIFQWFGDVIAPSSDLRKSSRQVTSPLNIAAAQIKSERLEKGLPVAAVNGPFFEQLISIGGQLR
jgi:hypothetical protein